MKKVLVNGLLFAGSMYAGILVLVYMSFSAVFYTFPTRPFRANCTCPRWISQLAEVSWEGEGALMSLWRAPKDDSQPVIIHFHGNAGSHYDRIPIYQAIAGEGAGVLGVGYPAMAAIPVTGTSYLSIRQRRPIMTG